MGLELNRRSSKLSASFVTPSISQQSSRYLSMTEINRIVAPGPTPHRVVDENGKDLTIPAGWELLPPGDAGLTRRVKAAGTTWTVKERRGRRVFSKGVWANAQQIADAKATLETERSTDSYQRRRKNDIARREKKQSEYEAEFENAVLKFLNFHRVHQGLAEQLAKAVTKHSTPVGSGTVARTQRIPVERRAESAVIAWMRHQTTAYDNLSVPRVKGKRRELRRKLAEQSKRLLGVYRTGGHVETDQCPLKTALAQRPNQS